MVRAAETVFLAKAWLETVRPIVEGYQRAILEQEKYAYAEKHHDRRGKVWADYISDPNQTYLMADDDHAHYVKRCNEERIKAGLKVDNEAYCPLLVADHMVIQAENALIDIMEPVTGLSRDRVYMLEDRKKLLDLTLRLLAPYCKTRKEAAQ